VVYLDESKIIPALYILNILTLKVSQQLNTMKSSWAISHVSTKWHFKACLCPHYQGLIPYVTTLYNCGKKSSKHVNNNKTETDATATS